MSAGLLSHRTQQVASVLIQPLDCCRREGVLELHSDEVEAGLWRDPALVDGMAGSIGNREVDPAVVRPVPGAPNHSLRLEHLITLRDRQTVANAGDPTDAL